MPGASFSKFLKIHYSEDSSPDEGFRCPPDAHDRLDAHRTHVFQSLSFHDSASILQ